MKSILSILLLCVPILNASVLNCDAQDFRPSDSLILDFCLNNESLVEVENLAFTANKGYRRINSQESVFALLREGLSLSVSPVSSVSPFSEDEESVHQTTISNPRTSPIEKQPGLSTSQNSYLYAQEYQNQRINLSPPVPICQYPQLKPARFVAVAPCLIFSPPPCSLIPVPQQPQQQQNKKHPKQKGFFRLFHFNAEGNPGDVFANLVTLKFLPRCIEDHDMFNNPSSYFLISTHYSNLIQVRNNLNNSVYFAIGLNPHNLAAIISVLEYLLWNYDLFIRKLITIVLDFKITEEGSTMIFVFPEKNKQLANEMRAAISKYGQTNELGTWRS